LQLNTGVRRLAAADMPIVQPTRLDLILAHAFQVWPAVWERLVRAGVDPAAVEAAWARYRDARDGVPAGRVTASDYARFYEAEPRRSPDRPTELCWAPALWPAHEWVCVEIAELGAVFYVGLRFRQPPRLEGIRTPYTLADVETALRMGEQTETEMEALLGPADADEFNGWSSEATYYYPLADGGVAEITTVHRVVVAVRRLAARPAHWSSEASGAHSLVAPASPIRRRWWQFWKPAA
jgi:hypothetical protein